MLTEPTILIRRGVAADANALAAFAARTFAETFAHTTTPLDMAAHLASAYSEERQGAEIRDPDTITLIAEHDGTMAAFAQVRRADTPDCVTDEAVVELRRFYVDRPFQGRGVALPLMYAAEQAARELGGRRVWLSVFQQNERAIAFYTRGGFVRVGAQIFRVGGDPQTDYIMVKELAEEHRAD